MASEGHRLFEYILRMENTENVVKFDYIVKIFSQNVMGKDPISAAQYADAQSYRLWNYVQKSNQSLVKEGRQPTLSIFDKEERLIFINKNTTNNRAMLHRSAVLRWIDGLSDRDYEFVGALAPELAGASKNRVTPPGNEAGIDFLSLGRVFGPLEAIHNNLENIRIVGQSKKYKDKVTVGRIREFSTTLNHIRSRAEDTAKHLPLWFKEKKGPILGWIVSHGGYQSGAIDMAQNEGIILSDTVALAEELIRKKSLAKRTANADVVLTLSSLLSEFKARQMLNA